MSIEFGNKVRAAAIGLASLAFGCRSTGTPSDSNPPMVQTYKYRNHCVTQFGGSIDLLQVFGLRSRAPTSQSNQTSTSEPGILAEDGPMGKNAPPPAEAPAADVVYPPQK